MRLPTFLAAILVLAALWLALWGLSILHRIDVHPAAEITWRMETADCPEDWEP